MKSYTLRPDTFTLNFNVTLSGTAACGEALLDIEYAKAIAGGDIPLTDIYASGYNLLKWAQTVEALADPPLIQSVSYGNDVRLILRGGFAGGAVTDDSGDCGVSKRFHLFTTLVSARGDSALPPTCRPSLTTTDLPPPPPPPPPPAQEAQQTGVAFMDSANTEFMKIGVRGVSILFASGDQGVCGREGCGGKRFHPDFPAGSPCVLREREREGRERNLPCRRVSACLRVMCVCVYLCMSLCEIERDREMNPPCPPVVSVCAVCVSMLLPMPV